MNIKTFIKKSSFLFVLLIGVSAGSVVYGTVNSMLNQSAAPSPNYPRNASGETYGSALSAKGQEKEPDLIKANGVDGTVGYVRSSDLIGTVPTSPKEALAQQNKAVSGREINLYESDGKTIIGKFKIDPGEVTMKDEKGEIIKPSK